MGRRQTLPPVVRVKQKIEKDSQIYLHLKERQVAFRVILTANDQDAQDEKKCRYGQSSPAQGLIIWTYKTKIKHSTIDPTGNNTQKAQSHVASYHS